MASGDEPGSPAATTPDPPPEPASIVPDESRGANQRAYLTVPTPASTLVLGHSGSAQNGYDGITGVTVKNVFMSGNNADSKMTLQAGGQVLIQSSTGALHAISTGAAYVGSAAQTYIAGANGAMLMAGKGPAPALQGSKGTDPADQAIQDVQEVAESVESGNKTREKLVAVAAGAISAVSGEAHGTGYLPVISGIGSAVLSLAGGAGKVWASVSGGPAPGTVAASVYGKDALSLTSGGGAMLYGTTVSVVGMIGIDLAAVGTIALTSTLCSSLTSGVKAEVIAVYKSEVLSGLLSILSSRRGKVEVLGPTIEVGTATPHFPQAPTKKVEIQTTGFGDIEIGTSKETEIHLDGLIQKLSIESKKDIAIEAKEAVEIKAEKKIVIEVGHWTVKIDGENNLVTVGKAEGSGPKVTINNDDIWVGHNNGEFIGLNKSSGITMNSKSNVLQFASAGVKINGSSIKLG